mgnify:CR=1 FL=1
MSTRPSAESSSAPSPTRSPASGAKPSSGLVVPKPKSTSGYSAEEIKELQELAKEVMAFEKASRVDLAPPKLENTMSFMFETRFPQHLTRFAATEAPLQDDYIDCWTSLEKKFDGTPGKKD